MAIADVLDLHAIQAERCKRSLKTFAKGVWPIVEPMPFIEGWCFDAIVTHLEALARGDIRKLVITIPPRHTKSLTLVIWRAWLWTQNPEAQILGASYSYALSLRDNLRVRRILEDPWFTERYGTLFQMASDQNIKSYFENTRKGYQMAISVDGGSTTGLGGSFLVLDDAHNATDAHSDAKCEAALNWFREVWTNRLNNQETDKMLAVGQRIRDMDVCGYILSERPDWEHLNLPAYYEPARKCITSIGWEDPRTVEGELLWPERFSKETLEGLRRDLGTNGFSAQYQQTPVPAGGGTFKEVWFRYLSIQGDNYVLETPTGLKHIQIAQCWRFTVVDLAISSKQDADYTVIQTYDVTPQNELLLIEQIRGHFDNPEQQKLIRLVHMRLHPRFVQVETVAYQLALVQQLRGAPIQVGDFLVEVANPEALDQTLKQLPQTGAFLVRTEEKGLSFAYARMEGYYVVRAMGDANYFQFAVTNQGYCKIIRQLDADDEQLNRITIPVREYKPIRDKVSRANSPAILMEQGNFYWLKTLSDIHIIKAEHLHFPFGSNDDMVDCSSQAAEVITTHQMPQHHIAAMQQRVQLAQQRGGLRA
jgi:phage terminase large subunit-like protein